MATIAIISTFIMAEYLIPHAKPSISPTRTASAFDGFSMYLRAAYIPRTVMRTSPWSMYARTAKRYTFLISR